MLMRSLSRRGSKLDKNPTPPPAEEDDGRVNVRAYNKKVRRGSPGSSAPPPQGSPPFPHSRATGVDGRGDDHASPEGHAHGRRLQTLRGAKGRRRELADFRARAASRGFAPRVGSPAPPFVRSQVANGQQIAKHARVMDLKRDAASPPMDPATALAQSLSLDGPEPCYSAYLDGYPSDLAARPTREKSRPPHCHSCFSSARACQLRPVEGVAKMGDNDDDMVTIRAHHKKVRRRPPSLRGRRRARRVLRDV